MNLNTITIFAIPFNPANHGGIAGAPAQIVVADNDPEFQDHSINGGATIDGDGGQTLDAPFGAFLAGTVVKSAYAWDVTNNTTGETGTAYLIRFYNASNVQIGADYRAFTIPVSTGDDLSFINGDPNGVVPYAEIADVIVDDTGVLHVFEGMSIQAAVDAAPDGATIMVHAGTFREQVEIDGRSGLTLVGAGDATIIEMPDAPQFVNATNTTRDRAAVISVENSTGITIEDVLVDGRGLGGEMPSGTIPDFEGIFFGNSSGTIDHVTVEGTRDELNLDGTPKGSQRGVGIVVLVDDGGPETVTITDSTVRDFQKNGIVVDGDGLTVDINGTTVEGAGFLPAPNAIAQNGIQISGGAGATISGNTISEIGFQRGDWITAGILAIGAADGLTITDNTIEGPVDGVGAPIPSTHAGIFVIGETDNAVVTGNTFDGVLNGIVLTGNVDNPTVTGNTFVDMIDEVITNVGQSPMFGTNVEYYGGFNNASVNLVGTDGPDILYGSNIEDTLDGGAGNDLLGGNPGKDVIDGGDGDDTVDGGTRATTTINLSPDSFVLDGDDTVSAVETIAFFDPLTFDVLSTLDVPSPVPAQAATEDDPITIDLAALMGLAAADFTFAVTGDPMAWLTLDPATGVLSGTPTDGDLAGTLSVTATETTGLVVTHDFDLTITFVNDAPVISVEAGDADSAVLIETNAGLTESGTLTVVDPDAADTVTVDVLSVATSGTTDGLGSDSAALLAMLTVTDGPIPADPGDTNNLAWTFDSGTEAFDYLAGTESLALDYTIEADDGNGGTTTDVISIVIDGTNDDPTIQRHGQLTFSEDAPLSGLRKFTVADPDKSDTVDVSIASVTASGDGAGNFTAAELEAFFAITPTTVAADVADPQPKNVDWTFNAAPGTFDYLAAGESLVITMTALADDGNGGTDDVSVNVTINGENDAPTIERHGQLNLSEDGPLSGLRKFTVVDVDTSDTVDVSIKSVTATGDGAGNFTAAELEAFFAITPTTVDADVADPQPRNVDWTFNAPAGTFDYLGHDDTLVITMTALADDGNGGTDEVSVNVTINGKNEAPVLDPVGPVATDEDTPVDVPLSASDPDSDPLTFSVVGAGPQLGTVTFTGTGFTYTPNANANGQDVFTIRVSDGDLTAEQEVTVDIAPVNDAPTAILPDNADAPENQAGAFVATLTTVDPDLDNEGDSHTYAIAAVRDANGDPVLDNPFEIVGDVLKVRDDATLDFDANAVFEVDVTTTDTGLLSLTETIVVDVLDDGVGSGWGPGFSLTGLDDWYNPAWGGGYNATFTYVVQEGDVIDGTVSAWQILPQYTGPGTISTGWSSGAPVDFGPNGDGDYAVSTVGQSFQLEYEPGDSIVFSLQVQGAPYDEDHFAFDFSDLDPAPNPAADPPVSILAAPTNDWGSGFVQQVTLANTGPLTVDGWTVELDTPAGVAILVSNVWGASVSVDGDGDLIFTPLSWNDTLAPSGGTAQFGFQGTYSGAAGLNLEAQDFAFV